MMKKTLFSLLVLLAALVAQAQTTLKVSVSNPLSVRRTAVPVTIQLESPVRSALVVDSRGEEQPCQLDDLDNDGRYECLSFIVAEIGGKKTLDYSVTLSNEGQPRAYTPQVYAEMMLTNKKIKSSNKQDLYISSLTVDNGTNPYWMLHHHGPAFENDMVAYRIYFDERQTVDIYGKYRRGLELRDTQFYPDSLQKATGYGDDVLWVGKTFGVGAMRGWNKGAMQMLQDVESRTLSVVSRGPLRTVVKVVDKGWNPRYPDTCTHDERIDMTTYYTLYAGRRDCQVDILFSRDASRLQLSTGLVNVKQSSEYSDGRGLRGCWGTDWPVSAKDSVGHKRETVGLGICLPSTNVISELPADKSNYPFVVGNIATSMRYHITFASDNETFPEGIHSAKAFFDYLKDWKRDIEHPCVISCSRR
ncbi:MAG: DUF4861 domain-containing protein [Prevotellaceae bacterium]|nr:DUF4861 domain-containing protein [Prevotellaceae bacterium]